MYKDLKKAINNPGRAIKYIGEKLLGAIRAKIYSNMFYYLYDYDTYYLKFTKSDVYENPEASVGPQELYEDMREWQIQYLTSQGLDPNDLFLDVGCGVLRGGIPIIRYLNVNKYYGMDISIDALEVAREELEKENLGSKNPTLIHNNGLGFSEPEFNGVKFDYIWAQSVITHLPPEKVEELLINIPNIMKQDGVFHATIWEATQKDKIMSDNKVDFHYSLSWLEDASPPNLEVTKVPADHPNNLQPIKFTLVRS